MTHRFWSFLILVLDSLFLNSCKNSAACNTTISKKIVPHLLQKVANFLVKTLESHRFISIYCTRQPSKNSRPIECSYKKFPYPPNQFFRHIQPLLNSILQGHNSISPKFYKLTKEEQKKAKNKKPALASNPMRIINGKLFTTDFFPDSSIGPGAEILKIEDYSFDSIKAYQQRNFHTDGFISSNFDRKLDQTLKNLIYTKHTFLDSIFFQYKTGEEIKTGYFKATNNNNGKQVFKLKSCKPISPHSKAFRGKLIVLIDGQSFSASCLAAHYLKTRRNATLISQEIGGMQKSTVARIPIFYSLPHSKLALNIRFMDIRVPNPNGEFDQGVLPHTPIAYRLEDYIQKKIGKLRQLGEIKKKF